MSGRSQRQDALLLMAHGSRNTEARQEYRRIHAALEARLSPIPVVFSVLEFPGDDLPSIQEGWSRCLAAGATRVVALPLFLFPAGHVREDLPSELREAREAGGWVDVELLPPLGAPDELLDALEARAAAAAEADVEGNTAVVLVGAGTSDSDANGDLCKTARLLWERLQDRYAMVEPAWISLTRPSVTETIDRCVKLGVERIVVVPFFLNTGVLLKRIDARLAEAREAHPAVSIARGEHLGLHPRLLDLLERRAREGLAGTAGIDGMTAVCGRPSCLSVVAGRLELARRSTQAV